MPARLPRAARLFSDAPGSSADPAVIAHPLHIKHDLRGRAGALFVALRPVQWIKNGVVFAGLVFAGLMFDAAAVVRAIVAALAFCVLSSAFYLINDVRDAPADRAHPVKRFRPVASGALEPRAAAVAALLLLAAAFALGAGLGAGFLLVLLGYSVLMAGYNLGLKQIVILDVFVIAAGFILRAAGGAIAVDVSISPWLLLCTMLLALLVGFGKRRHELVTLDDASRHRRNLELYTQAMLDQAVAVTAAGTLIAYAVYAFDGHTATAHPAMILTIPIVAYAVFRYLFLLYRRGRGGVPEAMVLTDRGLLTAIVLWALCSSAALYLVR
jgi:4-hydroxybenzoate polyprenyltransferase